VDRVVGVLKERGNLAKMPLSRTLGHGLFELRFTLDRRQMRITYTFKPGKRILLLTTFAKTRDNEQREVRRAREALEALAEGKW
jgi:hypothetical protein